jgi:hypothetical protein
LIVEFVFVFFNLLTVELVSPGMISQKRLRGENWWSRSVEYIEMVEDRSSFEREIEKEGSEDVMRKGEAE